MCDFNPYFVPDERPTIKWDRVREMFKFKITLEENEEYYQIRAHSQTFDKTLRTLLHKMSVEQECYWKEITLNEKIIQMIVRQFELEKWLNLKIEIEKCVI